MKEMSKRDRWLRKQPSLRYCTLQQDAAGRFIGVTSTAKTRCQMREAAAEMLRVSEWFDSEPGAV